MLLLRAVAVAAAAALPVQQSQRRAGSLTVLPMQQQLLQQLRELQSQLGLGQRQQLLLLLRC